MPKRETRSEVKRFWYVLVSTYQRKKGKLETHFFTKGQGMGSSMKEQAFSMSLSSLTLYYFLKSTSLFLLFPFRSVPHGAFSCIKDGS